ncbi:hypothetical protein MHU86_15208 [Fragilaria crotonensis]|nr:hypothetical protein MHU86_15208 [Fragilaria crotonensis]
MAVHSLATQVRREVHEIKLSQVADRTWMQRNFGIVNTNMRRLGITAAVRVVQGAGAIAGAGVGGGGNNDDNMLAAAGLQNLARTAAASLSPCPRNLYDLWAEYMFGIGGEEASIAVYTLGTWKIQAQVFSSECDLENGAKDGEQRFDL